MKSSRSVLARAVCLLVLVLFCIASMLPSAAYAQFPGRPMIVDGIVTLNGGVPPNGIPVVARVGGVERGRAPITDGGQYVVQVEGTTGDTIDFYLNSLAGTQHTPFNNTDNGGVLDNFNLAFTDNTPPGIPGNFRVIGYADVGKPVLSWDPSSDDTAVKSYMMKVDSQSDQDIGNVTQWTVQTALSLGDHQLSVKAVDAGGNQGQYSVLTATITSNPTITTTAGSATTSSSAESTTTSAATSSETTSSSVESTTSSTAESTTTSETTTAGTQSSASETTTPPETTVASNPPPARVGPCIVATAAYGSEMAPEVVYMRYVRDSLIGSTPTGRALVAAFNAFYYSWSPAVAEGVRGSELLRAVFRVLLLPIVGIVHITALVFTSITGMRGTADAASAIAFLAAATLSVTVYVVLPVLAVAEVRRAIRGHRLISSRPNPKC